MLKQIEIKVSLCKKSGIHQPIRLRKDGFTAKKSIEFAESNLLSVLDVKFSSTFTRTHCWFEFAEAWTQVKIWFTELWLYD